MRKAIIKIDIPTVKEEKGKIPMVYNVKGMIKIIEGQIATYC